MRIATFLEEVNETLDARAAAVVVVVVVVIFTVIVSGLIAERTEIIVNVEQPSRGHPPPGILMVHPPSTVAEVFTTSFPPAVNAIDNAVIRAIVPPPPPIAVVIIIVSTLVILIEG